jgi:hypothetical protein
VHFTGQSLGGALAEFAAYDSLKEQKPELLADAQAHITVTTFNGLGSQLVLKTVYPDFNPQLLANVSESAAYRVRNDLVSRLGGGHSGIPVYELDLHSDHYVPASAGGGGLQYWDLGPVEGHRIESGLYAHIAQSTVNDFDRSGPALPTDDGAFQMAQTARWMTLWDEVVNEKTLSPQDTYSRLAAGLVAGVEFGSTSELDTFARA